MQAMQKLADAIEKETYSHLAAIPGTIFGTILLAVCAVLARQRGWVRGGQPDTERVGRFAKGRGLLVF